MKIIKASKTVPADGRGTAAFRITLSETGDSLRPYATHFQNMEDSVRAGNLDSGKSMGHYFPNIREAEEDFYHRVSRGY